jgi:hypothetical protein
VRNASKTSNLASKLSPELSITLEYTSIKPLRRLRRGSSYEHTLERLKYVAKKPSEDCP